MLETSTNFQECAQAVLALLEMHRKAVEVAELTNRLDRLEEHAGLAR